MQEAHRVVSQPLDLHSFSIVNKRVDSVEANKDVAVETNKTIQDTQHKVHLERLPPPDIKPTSPRRAGIQLSLPLESTPTRERQSFDNPNRSPEGQVNDENYQQLLYKLAFKKRTITELTEQLKSEKKELKVIEESLSKYASSNSGGLNNSMTALNGSGSNDFIQNWSKQLHKTIDDVNNSPNVIKGKKSITNFFNKNEQQPVDTNVSSNQGTPFFKQLMNKFNEFKVNEDEEEEFDKSRKTDEFFVSTSTLNYEYDIDNIVEEEVEGILNITGNNINPRQTPLQMKQKPLNIKRQHL